MVVVKFFASSLAMSLITTTAVARVRAACVGSYIVRAQVTKRGGNNCEKREETDRNVLLIVRIEPGIIGGHIRGLFIATHKVHTIIDPFRHLAFFRP